MDVRIEPLGAHRSLVPTVARWHWDEWGHADPGGTREAWAEQIGARSGLRGVPSYYVAFAKTRAVGSVGLCQNDMTTRPHLSPWLSGLYVLPDFRRQRVASRLVLHAMTAARDAEVKQLYLHTAKAWRLYAALGWTTLDREHYEGEDVRVMTALLRDGGAAEPIEPSAS